MRIDTSKDIIKESLTTNTTIPPSGKLTVNGGAVVTGVLDTTSPLSVAEAVSEL